MRLKSISVWLWLQIYKAAQYHSSYHESNKLPYIYAYKMLGIANYLAYPLIDLEIN